MIAASSKLNNVDASLVCHYVSSTNFRERKPLSLSSSWTSVLCTFPCILTELITRESNLNPEFSSYYAGVKLWRNQSLIHVASWRKPVWCLPEPSKVLRTNNKSREEVAQTDKDARQNRGSCRYIFNLPNKQTNKK